MANDSVLVKISQLKEQSRDEIINGNIAKAIRLYSQAWELERVLLKANIIDFSET